MANLPESAAFDENVHEIGTDEFAMGGPGGTVNIPPATLASRTRYIKERFEEKHLATGEHDADKVKDELEEELVDAQFNEDADISEVKLSRSFVNRPRPSGLGVYSTSQDLVDDLKTLEVQKAHGDLLQSEIIIKTLGRIYQNVYGTSGDIYSGGTSLTGYTLVGDGGLFCKDDPTADYANAVRMEGDIRKLVDLYNIRPVTTQKVTFPEADVAFDEDRTDIMYFRCIVRCLTDTNEFYIQGNTHSSVISWSELTDAQRRTYLVDSAQNLFLKADNKVYQVQYAWVTEAGKSTMEECGYSGDPLDAMLYYSGDYFATPICTVDRRNQGAFHPEFNPLGSGYFMFGDNPALDDMRFEIGNSNQLLADNRDFTAWTAATGVVVSGTSVTGADGQVETLTHTIEGAVDSTRYVFFVDVSKAAGDEAARELEIAISVEDVSDTELDSVEATIDLTTDMQTAAVSIKTPAAGTDHLILHIGSGSSCAYAFETDYARCSEDTIPAATQYDIQATSTSANTFTLTGDQRSDFPIGWDVTLSGTVSGSDSNDGTFAVVGTVFDGTNTVIYVSPGFTYNTGNTGSAESTLWHYVNYCYTHQSYGVGEETTGSIGSGVSGRFDDKYHDEIDADSIIDQRIFLEAHGGSPRATLSDPLLSGAPGSANEGDIVNLTISNFDDTQTYHIAVSTGTVSRADGVITWTLPLIDSDSITVSLSIYTTNDAEEFSNVVVLSLAVYNVPIVGDEGIAEPEFIEADFEVLSNTVVADGTLQSTSLDGYAVTLPYTQEVGDNDWAKAAASIAVGSLVGSSPITVDTGLTNVSTLVGDIEHGKWGGGQVGVSIGGIDKIVSVLSESLVAGGGLQSGVEHVFNAANSDYISVTALSDTKALVAYRDNGNSSYGTACVLTVNGETVTHGAEHVFNAADSDYTSVTALSDTKALVAYRDAGNISYGTACVLTVNGETVTHGAEHVFNAANSSYISVTALSDTKALVAYWDGGNSYYGTACVIQMGPDTLTLTIPSQPSAPTAAWKPTLPIPESLLGADLTVQASIPGASYTGTFLPAVYGLAGTETEYLPYEDLSLAVDTVATTESMVVGVHSRNDLWDSGSPGNNTIGITVGGTELLVDALDVSKVTGAESTEYTITIATQPTPPTAAWKPSALLPPVPLSVDAGLTTVDTVVGATSNPRVLLGRDKVELDTGIANILTGEITGAGPVYTVTITVPTQSVIPTAATLIGNQLLPSTLSYDKALDKYTVEYTDQDLLEVGSVRQLKLGFSNLDADTKVNGLIVDLLRIY